MNIGTPGGIRTPDQLLRRQLLYPLSYGRKECRRRLSPLILEFSAFWATAQLDSRVLSLLG
jgi:hypothetical protein